MLTYLEHFQLSQSPFHQEPDPGIFYPGASRGEVLQFLLDDIQNGQPLIKLTGGEGVGKTLLYLLLVRKLSPETYDVVTLDHPVGSFEDLLGIICLALGYEAQDESAPVRYSDIFRKQLQLRKDRQRKVLLIIDEAEKLFLATLERLVKSICDTDEAAGLQILLVGRLDLDVSLEQLTIYCSNVDIYAGYVLEPLNFEETEEYIQFRMRSVEISSDKYLSPFTDDAVHAIYQGAEGNVSLTNILAEKGLERACSEGVFQVEPDFIGFRPSGRRSPPRLLSRVFRLTSPLNDQFRDSRVCELLKEYKWGAVAVALLFVLLLAVIWSGDEEEVQTSGTVDQGALEQVIIEEREVEQSQVREKTSSSIKKPVKVESVPPEVKAKPVPPEVSGQPEDRVDPRESKLIILQAEGRKKKIKAAPPVERPKTVSPARDGTAIFRERMKASSNWLAWAYRGGYTVQLMRLTSDNAEDNLKQILVEDEYYAARDDLYILKGNSPPAFFVFYGMYDTMEQARRARNSMPIFLRRHHPYALSIKAALKKTDE